MVQIDYKANFVAYQNSEISSHEVGTQNRRYDYGIAHQRSDTQKSQITAKFTGPGQSHYVSIVVAYVLFGVSDISNGEVWAVAELTRVCLYLAKILRAAGMDRSVRMVKPVKYV